MGGVMGDIETLLKIDGDFRKVLKSLSMSEWTLNGALRRKTRRVIELMEKIACVRRELAQIDLQSNSQSQSKGEHETDIR